MPWDRPNANLPHQAGQEAPRIGMSAVFQIVAGRDLSLFRTQFFFPWGILQVAAITPAIVLQSGDMCGYSGAPGGMPSSWTEAAKQANRSASRRLAAPGKLREKFANCGGRWKSIVGLVAAGHLTEVGIGGVLLAGSGNVLETATENRHASSSAGGE